MAKKQKVLTAHQQELENEVQRQISEKFANKDKKVKSTKNIKKLIPFYAKHKGLFILFVSLMIALLGISFFEPIISSQIVQFFTVKNFNSAIRFAIYYVLIGLVLAVMNYFIAIIRNRLYHNLSFDLTQKMSKTITSLTMKRINNTNSGVLISRINSDCSKCSNTITQITNAILNVISSLAFFIYIAFLNIWLFLVLLAFIFVRYAVDAIRFAMFRKHERVNRARYDNAASTYYEQIKGIQDVKTLNMRDNMLKVSGEKMQYTCDKFFEHSKRVNGIYYFTSFPLSYVIEFVIVVLGLVLIKANLIDFAGFMVVFMYKGRAISLASAITMLKENITEGELSAERYFDVIENYEQETFGNIEKTISNGEIQIKNVHFEYEKGTKVLNGVNLTIKPNQTTAIVGSSGGGKTTLLAMIGRLYDPTSGKVLIDETDLKDLTENALRNAIGIVNQNPYIFNASVRNNMLYVKPDATEKEIWEALEKAQIADFIRGLDKGLDSMVGENGVKVSGGQKQRLAIARVLLKGNRVLVFDEATSALDNSSQSAIVNELNQLTNDHTIIVVAHRLSTIVNANNIVVLNEGKVEAEGTHKELMKSCKLYKTLYEQEENEKRAN